MYEGEDSGFTLFGTRIHVSPDANFSDRSDEVVTMDDHPDEEDTGKVDHEPGMEKKPEKIIPCPRCKSMDTKFCYFNNYNVNQPRHFCRNCQRYWTSGGAMRSVPVGAGRRKAKPSPPPVIVIAPEDKDDIHIVDATKEETVPVPSMVLPPHPVYCYPWGFYPLPNYWGCMPFWPGGGAVPTSSGTASSSCSSGDALGKHGREETLTLDHHKAGGVCAKRTHNNKRIQ